MATGLYKEPPTAGTPDPSVFEGIAQITGNSSMTAQRRQERWATYNPQLEEILEPFHQSQILNNPLLDLKDEPFAVRYTIKNGTLAPEESLLPEAAIWHTDTPEPSIIASDVLPLEVIVEDKEIPFGILNKLRLQRNMHLFNQLYIPAGYRHKGHLSEQALARVGLKIMSPEPGTSVVVEKQFHRSPRNTTDEAVVRNWIRATIQMRPTFGQRIYG